MIHYILMLTATLLYPQGGGDAAPAVSMTALGHYPTPAACKAAERSIPLEPERIGHGAVVYRSDCVAVSEAVDGAADLLVTVTASRLGVTNNASLAALSLSAASAEACKRIATAFLQRPERLVMDRVVLSYTARCLPRPSKSASSLAGEMDSQEPKANLPAKGNDSGRAAVQRSRPQGPYVQIATYFESGSALQEAERIEQSQPLNGGASALSVHESRLRDGRTGYSLVVTGFPNVGEAKSYCDAIRQEGGDCIARQ
jgi:hypothetical protein